MRSFLCASLLLAAGAMPLCAQVESNVVAGSDVSIGSPLSLTFYVAPKHPAAAEAYAQTLQTPGSQNYHNFLTVQQFVTRFAVNNAELKTIESNLENLGFTIGYVYPNHMAIEVLGSVGTAQAALGVKMKHFTVKGRDGIASVTPVTLPPQLRDTIHAVGGLNTVRHPQPRHTVSLGTPLAGRKVADGLVGGKPGEYLPADFANFYDVGPLYEQGLSGKGSTIGIVTLNTFDASDAYLFWNAIGLNVSPTRITKVNVDGGETATSNNPDGEGETDLDVEYSGALAPDADVRVYIAPNLSDSDYINAFMAATSDNIVDTISTSWGEPELFYFYDVATGGPSYTALLKVYHDAFLEMAIQGQTIYAASGDSGAFDTVRGCPAFGTPTAKTPVCNAPYAVDTPADDPLVTAAGGTTLPFAAKFKDGAIIVVPNERAWGWDYFVKQGAAQGLGADFALPYVFSVGGGGGVSSLWPKPWYQQGVPGMKRTQPGQFFSVDFGKGSETQYVLPDYFAGRNLPDISANADPYSGYILVQGAKAYGGAGGTSFVGPQLNGVTALYVEALGNRVGQIAPAIYQLGSGGTNDIHRGDNWGYQAVPGFDDATGMGALDAANLLYGIEALELQP